MQPTASSKMTTRTKVVLWLMIGPTGLFVVTFILFALSNFVTASISASGGSTVSAILNIIFFLTGAISIIAWVPGLITGIILIATKK